MPEREFYQLCAIHMMERSVELTGKLGLEASGSKEHIAKLAFDYADAMLAEYHERAKYNLIC